MIPTKKMSKQPGNLSAKRQQLPTPCTQCGAIDTHVCCSNCDTKRLPTQLCLDCFKNSSCARCGRLIPYQKENSHLMKVCSVCELELESQLGKV